MNFLFFLEKSKLISNNIYDKEFQKKYKGKNFVNNFTIYELNMDYYLNLWYSKNEELIEK